MSEAEKGQIADPMRVLRAAGMGSRPRPWPWITAEGSRPWFGLPAALLAVAVAALAVDCPFSQWCLQGNLPTSLKKVLHMAEPFGNGLGVLLIVIGIHQLDRERRWALPRVLLCSLGAGLAADVIKLSVVRLRPYNFQFDGNVWTTFGDWLPWISAGSAGQSFPSAHTATAAGLAVALIWLYPGARRIVPALAVLVACERVAHGAHYLSDVLVGGALGVAVAKAALSRGWLNRWEQRWKTSTAL